jgi:hypothetical protein
VTNATSVSLAIPPGPNYKHSLIGLGILVLTYRNLHDLRMSRSEKMDYLQLVVLCPLIAGKLWISSEIAWIMVKISLQIYSVGCFQQHSP